MMAPDKRRQDRPAGDRQTGSRITDPRFESIQNSSLYKRPSTKKTQVTLDKRFASVLTDDRFSSKAKVDRYGRKLRTSKDGQSRKPNAELARMYRVEDEEVEDDIDSDDDVQAELSRVNKNSAVPGYDPARDGGFEDSSSSEEDSDEDSDLDADEGVELDGLGAADDSAAEAAPAGEVSRRLAVVNLDWDHIRAVDLLAVFSSYGGTGSSSDRVERVTIYPSEFGKERMEREELEGPPKELFASKKRAPIIEEDEDSEDEASGNNDDDDEDEDERIRKSLIQEDNGEEVSSTKLRNYQLERLRYFYAVVTCSNEAVAKQIYDNVDGREYLTSANFFDLRFVPDEMDFSDDKPRDEATKVPHGYRPSDFVTAALQHSKVKLTWDADDTQRKEIQQRAFSGSRKDLDENELRAYLASDNSSDEDEEDGGVEIIDSTIGATATITKNEPTPKVGPKLSKGELKRQQMRAKLGLTDEPVQAASENKPIGDMQVTFTPGFSSSEKKPSVFENQPEIEETTAERYIRKERERKARRKEKLKADRGEGKGEAEPEADTAPADEGFDDPFFTATPAEAEALKAQKVIDKKKERRQKRMAEDKVNAEEAAELERILKSNSKDEPGKETSSFSMAALEKAEKAIRKQKLKKGKGRLSEREKAALEAKAKDNFEMDVEDKRFAAVFERPEFALDPSHPRFRDTEGMKSLLQEARQRRKRDIEEDSEDGGVPVGKKGRKR